MLGLTTPQAQEHALSLQMQLLQINPRTSLLWQLKAAAILATWAASFYCTFFLRQSFAVRSNPLQPRPFPSHPTG
jgi:hypothetical protein